MTAFARVIADIKNDRLAFEFQYDTRCPGTYAIIATTPSLPYPCGLIWYRWLGNTSAIDILNMYVVADLRRLGIAKFLHGKLVGCYPDCREVYTQCANRFSAPWLKATGFKKRKTGWHLAVAYKNRRR